mmetsp:Transcript_44132/g.99486  ORF Transcript_44132/g.99486 Transcript_44132/m.99486 type:complete len:209 (+) Transcript_44132:1406-2032(+)
MMLRDSTLVVIPPCPKQQDASATHCRQCIGFASSWSATLPRSLAALKLWQGTRASMWNSPRTRTTKMTPFFARTGSPSSSTRRAPARGFPPSTAAHTPTKPSGAGSICAASSTGGGSSTTGFSPCPITACSTMHPSCLTSTTTSTTTSYTTGPMSWMRSAWGMRVSCLGACSPLPCGRSRRSLGCRRGRSGRSGLVSPGGLCPRCWAT